MQLHLLQSNLLEQSTVPNHPYPRQQLNHHLIDKGRMKADCGARSPISSYSVQLRLAGRCRSPRSLLTCRAGVYDVAPKTSDSGRSHSTCSGIWLEKAGHYTGFEADFTANCIFSFHSPFSSSRAFRAATLIAPALKGSSL